ncbi:chitinase [Microdochium trichocladiopsis]|uniref:chitinase n=1 Tax=Microdochium trichocladiopsis TaxID=1682393 RepID=A0A9P8XSH9_9PEZI|nr:chitinase [Microdochium trichocladiopsis]KAH7014604.1 chitinase [Microdochium trichocladiopsis]
MRLHDYYLLASVLIGSTLAQEPKETCPRMCAESGVDPAAWDVRQSLAETFYCPRPILIDMTLGVPADEQQPFRVCDAWGTYYYYQPKVLVAAAADETVEVTPLLAWTNSSSAQRTAVRAVTPLEEIRAYLGRTGQAGWNKTAMFSAYNGATVGVFVGQSLLSSSAADKLISPLIDKVRESGLGADSSALLQVCGEDKTVDQTFGVVVASTLDLTVVQKMVNTWANASCVDTASFGTSIELNSTTVVGRTVLPLVPSNSTVPSNTTEHLARHLRGSSGYLLHARADCRAISVDNGDGCDSLAAKCGISASDFDKYNTDKNLCSTLMKGQHVCCSSGSMPDFTPKPNPDGSCATYTTKQDDTCSAIAAANSLKVDDLENMNKKTWAGWAGCNRLFVGVVMCLSKGSPPFPQSIPNAICGPQKPGSEPPTDGSDIAEMNPCPLNVCCNIWGQCGLSDDFCIDTRGDGAPGTAKPETNGCISNCGLDIVKGSAPAQFIKLGYFEAFNLNRECLNMDVSQIDKSYTHVHFAFGMLTNDFEVYFEDAYQEYQFKEFKKMTGIKKIISFGGWVFSNDRKYYSIFRNGVKPANRDKLASSLAKFVNDNGLDGVDIDWEYPGADDIPGTPPPDDKNEGVSYAAFLTLLKAKLGNKSVSIAAPASYWYLRNFPIKGIGKIVDYIVYMTYDLHGQWDAGSKWASPGCPQGSCLRSQVNITETNYALALITKAGVPSSKVIVGVTSYGRSFRMADPSCRGPQCLFVGHAGEDGSQATPGRCTATKGYISNAEIGEYASGRKRGADMWYDEESDSNMMVYDNNNWVAYMNEAVRTKRTNQYKGFNLGGTTNWAVDLDQFNAPPGLGPDGDIRLTWGQIKNNIVKKGEAVTCDLEARTGTWVTKDCQAEEVRLWTKYTPAARWDNLDCGHALDDALMRWKLCDGPAKNATFSDSLSQFFHQVEGTGCKNLALVDNCNPDAKCETHASSGDHPSGVTGACSYIVWNSLAQVHAMIKNYSASLKAAAQQVQNNKAEFIGTFAPNGQRPNYPLGLAILFTILQIPSTALGTLFWKGFMKEMPFFKDKSLSLDLAKDSSQALVMAGFDISKRVIAQNTIKEVTFSLLYDKLIDAWINQVDQLVVELFDGSSEHIKQLVTIMGKGQMVPGSLSGQAGSTDSNVDHTKAFLEQKAAERAFYAAAIPSVWKMRQPYTQYPAVLDFGPDCSRDIGAGQFFDSSKDNKYDYKHGRVCIDDHNYILAGTYDRDNDGPNCSPEYWDWCNHPDPSWAPLFGLPGLDKIVQKEDRWGGVTVEDLVRGAVNTWKRNGKLNLMDGNEGVADPSNKEDFDSLWENDITAPGTIRIPVCNPKEAEVLGTDGLGHGIPDGDKLSFPCLRDPSKRYESEWVTWPKDM